MTSPPFSVICPFCNKPMSEIKTEVWYCESDDVKLIEDASGK